VLYLVFTFLLCSFLPEASCAKIFSLIMFISFSGKRNEPKKSRHVADFYFASLNGGSAKLACKQASDKSLRFRLIRFAHNKICSMCSNTIRFSALVNNQ